MPSQETALKPKKEKLIKCEVLKAIGVDASIADIKKLERRAETKGLKFVKDGLTTTIYPAKPFYDKQKKDFIPGDPVFVELSKEAADKLSRAGAVRIDVSNL